MHAAKDAALVSASFSAQALMKIIHTLITILFFHFLRFKENKETLNTTGNKQMRFADKLKFNALAKWEHFYIDYEGLSLFN